MEEEKNENGVVQHHGNSNQMDKNDANVDQMEIDGTSTMTAFGPSSNDDGQFVAASFFLKYPKIIEAKLQEAWPKLKSTLEKYGISCTLNLVEGSMKICTIRKNRDPRCFARAKVILRLLAKNAPPLAALSVLWRQLDAICIGAKEHGLCLKFGINEEQYVKRRKLLSRSALEELKQLSGCDLLFLHGDILVATGSAEGLKLVRKIVEDCMAHRICPKSQIRRIKSMNGLIDDLGALRF